jgi:hypothetical protein
MNAIQRIMGIVNRLDENKLTAELETLAILAERIEFGAGKYGPLHIDSSRDWVKEAHEEALDMSVYLTWKRMQHAAAQKAMGGE